MSNDVEYEPISQTEPQTPEDLANADETNDVYIEFTEVGRAGIRSISGPVTSVYEDEEVAIHAGTIMVEDNDFGTFEFILKHDAEGDVFLDPRIEANTHVQGYTCLEIDEVETLEIGGRGDYSGV